jgi:hypothetical protein
MDFITPTPDGEHVLVSPLHPDRAFARFDDEDDDARAAQAMPGIAMRDAVWLSEYDDYYYKTVSSFDLGLPRMARTLPVLRVRYEDAADTWLYLTPAPGQSYKAGASRSGEPVGLLRPARPGLRVPLSAPSALGPRRGRPARRGRRVERHQHHARIPAARPTCTRLIREAAPRHPSGLSRRQWSPACRRTGS